MVGGTMSDPKDTPDKTNCSWRVTPSHKQRKVLPRILFALIGFAALLWCLLRVVPRPSRASYPCMRVTMPLASGFIIWLAGLFGSGLLLYRGKVLLRKRSRVAACICLLLGVIVGAAFLLGQPGERALAEQQVANDPIGEAKGVHPGRVVWVHDASATDWPGPGDGHWWEPAHTDYTVVEEMVSLALRRLSGQNNESVAWDALVHYFNIRNTRGDVGYTSGEKITIKVNYVGCHATSGGVDPVSYDLTSRRDYPNTSPQVILAVLKHGFN